MSEITLPARAQRRGLSVEAYLNDLEASRRWKREHREQNQKSQWATCECGNRMAHRAERCCECLATERKFRNALIEQMWQEGYTLRQISEALGLKYRKANLALWRQRGLNLPYRRTPEQVARIRAASDGFQGARAMLDSRRAA